MKKIVGLLFISVLLITGCSIRRLDNNISDNIKTILDFYKEYNNSKRYDSKCINKDMNIFIIGGKSIYEQVNELGIVDTATTLFGDRNDLVAKEDIINGTTILKPLILPEGCSLDAFEEVVHNMEHPYDLVGDKDVNKLKK